MLKALCSAIELPSGTVPDWLHLLPVGEISTNDGRGPYRAPDASALIASSLVGGKLCLDENHATDLLAPKGGSAPARGWIVELQSRDDGIWGRVEWTPAGRRLMEAGEYRGVSPVIAHRRDGTVTAILRASLTNTPNLRGLTSLHSASAAGRSSAQSEALQNALSDADRHVIALMGVDPAAYAENRAATSPGEAVSRHAATRRGGALSAAEQRVIDAMGLDPAAFVGARDQAR